MQPLSLKFKGSQEDMLPSGWTFQIWRGNGSMTHIIHQAFEILPRVSKSSVSELNDTASPCPETSLRLARNTAWKFQLVLSGFGYGLGLHLNNFGSIRGL